MRKSRVYLALLHHPAYNKRMDVITTSVTNLDLHDICRAARTYNVEGFYVVHPSENQHTLLEQILDYWKKGYGGEYNSDRKEAFKIMRLAWNLEEVIVEIKKETGQRPVKVATGATTYPEAISYQSVKKQIYEEEEVFLILFGTGWGIARECIANCDYILEPIQPSSDYNHLSVRSAVSIIIDRLLGESWFEN